MGIISKRVDDFARIQGVKGPRIRVKCLRIIKNEKYGRKTTADDLRSLYIAYGAICELETQLLLSGDLNYVNKESLKALKDDTEEVERMLYALIKSLENKRLAP